MSDVSMRATNFHWLDVMTEVSFMTLANSDMGVRYGM